jgi:D-glycero-D-manno-heptose 1,7-bisphosphate phosphatase
MCEVRVLAVEVRVVAQAGGHIDAVFFCPHGPEDKCQCRKPLPGLFEQIGERLGMDLKGTHVVGDSLRDLLAGVAVGCTPHLVHTGKGFAFQGQPLPTTFPSHTQTHADLAGFVDWLLDEPSTHLRSH